MLNRAEPETFGLTSRIDDEVEVELAGALRELCDLLDEYGPMWYTKEHHDRARAALRLAHRARAAQASQ